MNLKKLLALLMAVVMVFCLAACGNGAESDSDDDDDDKKSTSANKDEDKKEEDKDEDKKEEDKEEDKKPEDKEEDKEDEKKPESSANLNGQWAAMFTVDAEDMDMEGYDVSLDMYFEMTIEDGEFAMGVNADKMRDSYIEFTEDVAVITWEELIVNYDSEEEAEEAMEMTREEFIQAIIDEVDIDAALEDLELTIEGTVELDGDQITLTPNDEDDEPAVGTWDGSNIILAEELEDIYMELVFERV